MAVERISTYSLHQRTLIDVNRTQSTLADLQNQISSGFKADNFAGLEGEVEQFVSVGARMLKSKTYQESNSLALTRIKATNVAVNNIIEISDDIENLLVLRRNPANADTIAFRQQMEQLRDTFTAQLNSATGGRYIFGGTKTNFAPVPEPVPDPVVDGVPDAGYYNGSTEDYTVRAQDNVELAYNIRADNSAFQKIYAGIAMGLKADTTTLDSDFQAAYKLVREGMDELVGLQAQTNADLVNIEKINDRHESMELYWKGVSEELIKTDLLSASTQVAVNQGVLQASFQAFARINTLRLSDFL